ncbi:hypothetical protein [Xanthomonas sp. 3058]|uniref:hypothetical protein n=1 Tax=Xanthomonas sp. 3058 TaxID=3035314 RepID=UPI0016203A9C|nr:hypothetical protein [Xanthomonas sp. 3058]MBB5864129.1 hypothetical protein [Xanthomonas sp. 3058]
MPLLVEGQWHEMSIEDDDLDLFAVAAGAVDHKASPDLVAIWQVSAQDLDPVGFVDTAPRVRRMDRRNGAANLQREFASCTPAKGEARPYRSIGGRGVVLPTLGECRAEACPLAASVWLFLPPRIG